MSSRPVTRFFKIVREEGPSAAVESTQQFVRSKLPFKSKHPERIKAESYKEYLKNRIRYTAPAHPFKTIQVNAADVTHSVSATYHGGLGRIEDGDWDQRANLRSLHSHMAFNSLKQRFEEGRDWKETDYLKEAEKEMQGGEDYRGCSSIEQFINERCAYIDELYTDIKENGYRSQSELEDPEGPGTSPHRLEPIVTISRDGEIYFTNSGQHRFAIAQLLDLQIPCNVAVRHKKWQLIRDEVYQADSNEEYQALRSHPDLQDLTSRPPLAAP